MKRVENTFMKIPNTGNLTNYIQKNRLIKIQSYKNIPDGYNSSDFTDYTRASVFLDKRVKYIK